MRHCSQSLNYAVIRKIRSGKIPRLGSSAIVPRSYEKTNKYDNKALESQLQVQPVNEETISEK